MNMIDYPKYQYLILFRRNRNNVKSYHFTPSKEHMVFTYVSFLVFTLKLASLAKESDDAIAVYTDSVPYSFAVYVLAKSVLIPRPAASPTASILAPRNINTQEYFDC